MQFVENEFQQRVDEIELYFSFLKEIDKERSSITVPVRIGAYKTKTTTIGQDVKVILKANVFLLLYNLIEATTEKSLEHLFATLQDEQIGYRQASPSLRELWRRERVRDLQGARVDTMSDRVRGLIEDVVNNEAISLEMNRVRRLYQGNVDADQIRQIAREIGFDLRIRKNAYGGQQLQLIRQKRNDLAHGNFSFGETGRDFSIRELEETKKQVVRFLRDLLKAVNRYLEREHYRAT